MSDEQLKVDLAALARLSPQLEELAKKLMDAAAKSPGAGGAGDSPSVVAARRLAGRAIPGVQRTVAARLRTVGDWTVQAHNGFADTEDDMRRLFEASSPLRATHDVPGDR